MDTRRKKTEEKRDEMILRGSLVSVGCKLRRSEVFGQVCEAVHEMLKMMTVTHMILMFRGIFICLNTNYRMDVIVLDIVIDF